MPRHNFWSFRAAGARRALLVIGVSLCSVLPAMPWVRSASAQEVVRIATLPGLRYDTASFSVRPGAEVRLEFANYDEMLHNMVITRPGARERVVQAALALGAGAADRHFVPGIPEVLWSTPLVDSGRSFTLTFTAPTETGDYPFVCTVPGHGLIMFGTMSVTPSPRPPVMTAVDAPDPMHHPMASSRVMRGFMPEAGPASISVELPGAVSYVWDAGAGRFRYAWRGANPTLPSSPERGLARRDGAVFYREPAYPLRFGPSPETMPGPIQFRGYTLDAEGIPEFETQTGAITIRERAVVADGRFVRRFRITGSDVVWFSAPASAAGLEAPGSTRQGAFLRFEGPAAAEFTVSHPIPPPAPGAVVP